MDQFKSIETTELVKIANAIRLKKGSTDKISLEDMPAMIREIEAAGGDTGAEDALVTGDMSSYTNSRVSSVGQCAFAYASKLQSVNFPAATIIGSSAFTSCSSLTTVSFPVATTISDCAFSWCTKLATASFPTATTVGGYAFYSCSRLTTANFPAATSISGSAFAWCSSLTVASFPVATIIGGNVFRNCRKLTIISFPAATTIGSSAFCSCYNLKSLFLLGPSVCTLSNSNAFSSTPIGGYSTSAGTYGSIYVPASLLTSYQTATNWTYFSSRFVAINGGGDVITFTINGIEYQAEDGMTWSEWVNSEYNTIGCYDDGHDITCINTGIITNAPDGIPLYIYDQDWNDGMSGKPIIEGHNYRLDE